MSLGINNLRDQLAELKRQETIAQTREQMLNTEKEELLVSINTILAEVKALNIIEEEDLNPHNLSLILDKLKNHIEREAKACQLDN
jgi:hypothetical protein